MSAEAVQTIIGRAVTDGEFAKQLFENPEEALKGYELSAEEATAIKNMKADDVAKFHASLDERISKGDYYRMSPGGGTWSY